MKKTVLSGFFIMSLLFIALLSSCKKEEATNAPSTVGTATLSGQVQAELDLTNTSMENAPSGTKIVAVINSGDLVPDYKEGMVYENITYETTVDGGGNYTFSGIAAANKEVTVTVYPADFVYYQKQPDNSTVRKVYSIATPLTQIVIKGTSKVLDINYGGGSK